MTKLAAALALSGIPLDTPTYSYAYHDATVDGLTRLSELMGLAEVFGTASV